MLNDLYATTECKKFVVNIQELFQIYIYIYCMINKFGMSYVLRTRGSWPVLFA
jgi:hypothetical protein